MNIESLEFKRQFRVILWPSNDMITIDFPSDRLTAKEFRLKIRKKIQVGLHDWIETKENALNYYECCGILILFGIQPPTFEELIQETVNTERTQHGSHTF